jgi:hypothetical protein
LALVTDRYREVQSIEIYRVTIKALATVYPEHNWDAVSIFGLEIDNCVDISW